MSRVSCARVATPARSPPPKSPKAMMGGLARFTMPRCARAGAAPRGRWTTTARHRLWASSARGAPSVVRSSGRRAAPGAPYPGGVHTNTAVVFFGL